MQLLEGFFLGHWTDTANGTGCTVLRCPPRTVASCEVRGSSPGSQELVLLDIDKRVQALAVLLTNAGLTKVHCFRLAQRMHDGMSRAVVPVHTSFDGDTTFALSSGVVTADIDLLGECAAQLTSEAIRSAVRHASDAFGIPAASGSSVRSASPAPSL